MSEDDPTYSVCREWVLKAENDLTNAAYVLKLGEACPTDTVCFHAQQCVEKYIKAIFVIAGVDFPKSHDLEKLVDLLPTQTRLTLSREEQGLLTDYAAGARYPGWEEIPLSEARRAVAIARRIRKEARRYIPRSILRKR